MKKHVNQEYQSKQGRRILTRYQRRKFPEFFKARTTGAEDYCAICNEALDSTGFCPNCSGAHHD